jgi:hypothetical protein
MTSIEEVQAELKEVKAKLKEVDSELKEVKLLVENDPSTITLLIWLKQCKNVYFTF